jgi:carboxymethylenebutenolidase
MLGIPADKMGLDIAAAVRAVEGRGGVSVLGFCLGGGLALRAAAELDLAGAVSYYGTRLGAFLDKSPRCPMLFHFGGTDTHSPPEVIEAVKKAIPSAETHVYQAGHAFANDARTSYVKDAAEAAHARTLEFLRKVHAR